VFACGLHGGGGVGCGAERLDRDARDRSDMLLLCDRIGVGGWLAAPWWGLCYLASSLIFAFFAFRDLVAGGFALPVLVDVGRAARREDRASAARLHEVSRLSHLRREVALRGAAVVPVRTVGDIGRVRRGADILGPQAAWAGFSDHLGIVDADRPEPRRV